MFLDLFSHPDYGTRTQNSEDGESVETFLGKC